MNHEMLENTWRRLAPQSRSSAGRPGCGSGFSSLEAVGQALKRVRNDTAATLVEAAVSATLLIVMLIGIMETSLLLYSYLFVSDAAREATRYAMVRGSISCTSSPDLSHCNASGSDIQNYIKTLGYPGLIAANLTATTKWLSVSSGPPASWSLCTSGTCNAPGNIVQVKVQYVFQFSIPFVPVNSFTMSSTSQMVIAQ